MKTLSDTLALITAAACTAIEWVECAGIFVSYAGGEIATLAATDPLVLKADAAQAELSEGPSVQVALGETLVHSEDLAADRRWPQYGRRAAEMGLRAQTALRVAPISHHQTHGLSLYSTTRRGLDGASSGLARMFAEQAATAIGCASRVETLTEAVGSRQDISQAVGIVMERFELNESRAFEYLVKVSQSSQVKVRVIARELIEQSNARDAACGSEISMDRNGPVAPP